jgi:hypothetical protein
MTHRLPALPAFWILLVVLVPPSARGQPLGGGGPQALLAAAIRTLDARQSVSATIRYEANLFDKQLVGSGSYLEQRHDGQRLFRLQLRTQIGDQQSSLLQVCDGRFLWIYRKLPSETNLGRIDVARATRAIQEAASPPGQAGTALLPGLGGLPKLLGGLDASFDFTVVEQGRWGRPKQPVWRLEGQWKQPQLVRLLPSQKEAILRGEPANLAKLPEHVPDRVVLLLGQDDLFPYRIEYCRTRPEKSDQPDAPTSRPLVTMDLFEVSINVPIDPGQFVYPAGKDQPVDETEGFLQTLGVRR